MRIGQVIGKITLDPKVCAYTGGRFLVVHPLSRKQLGGASLKPLTKGSSLIVYDNLGAREGDIIGYSESGEAAAAFEDPTPVDAYNAAILDSITYTPPGAT